MHRTMELYHDFDVHVLDGTKGEKIASIGPSSVVEEEVHMEDKENGAWNNGTTGNM